MTCSRLLFRALVALLCVAPTTAQDVADAPLPRADGYRGIWYSNQPSNDEYRYKYSGGFATYPQQHLPIAYYSATANKTFFVYGGSSDEGSLLHMVSYFDHATGTVPRPVVLLDKETKDAHDNPTLMLDDDGYLWVFSNAHGTSRPAFIHKSREPHSIDAFERVRTTNFSYSQPWFVGEHGFCFLHTRYEEGGRSLYVERSSDGSDWSEPRLFARAQRGHYQVSWRHDANTIATAFNVHPDEGGLNARTNLYYAQSTDGGANWETAGGTKLELPLTTLDNGALVHDYLAEDRLVYLKDLQFDANGDPIVVFLTSDGYRSGPDNDPRIWHTAHFVDDRWRIREITRSDHNYDFGSLYVEPDGSWRLIAPTDPGPQPYGTGGEMVSWTSDDAGASWKRRRAVTHGSVRNHTYARRPVAAHPDFYVLWADGDAFRPSASALWFSNRDGDRVFRLPTRFATDEESHVPERVR